MIFASDLDRTLIYSKRAFLLEPDERPALRLIETLDGKDISYMTVKAIALLQELSETLTFIPVTTRTTEQYSRITLFQEEIQPAYAVTSNGANVLQNGKPDEDWAGSIKGALANDCLPIPEVLEAFAEISHADWVLKTKTAETFFVYHIVEAGSVPADELLDFEHWLSAQNWSMSLQGRKLYFVPNAINKADAVTYIQGLTGQKTLIAAGDSRLDLPLLQAADAAICPQHGELYQSLDPARFTITKAKGIKASEEILSGVLDFHRDAQLIKSGSGRDS